MALLVLAEALRRLITGAVPSDMSAYIAAADVFSRGQNPYGPALFDSGLYDGFVYVYPPGTLPLIEPLSLVAPRIISALDVVVRVVVIAFSLGWMRRALGLVIPLSWLVCLAVLYEPFLVDLLAGNLCTYMFGAFVACMWMGHDKPRLWHAFAAVALGVVLAFKPMWGLPTGLILLVRGRYKMAAGLLTGAAMVAGASLLAWSGEVLVDSWIGRIEAVRAHYRSADLLSLMPQMFPVGAALWVAGGALLIRRRGAQDPLLWLWACVSLFAWPRLGSYSFVFLIPALCFLWTRWGWRKAAAASLVALGPLPWMMRALDYGYAHQALLFAWACVIAAVVFWQLWRRPVDT